MEPVIVPLEDHIDLHTFQPREVRDLVAEYLRACREAGVLRVRIIHGKGKGFLRETVHKCLRGSALVASFAQAPPEAGGWGATMVELKAPDGD